MRVELDRKDLEALIKGYGVSYSGFSHPWLSWLDIVIVITAKYKSAINKELFRFSDVIYKTKKI